MHPNSHNGDSDDTARLLPYRDSNTQYGATHDRNERMAFLSHDHAYEHPHHGVGLREGENGMQRPVPVARPLSNSMKGTALGVAAAYRFTTPVQDDDEGNPHSIPRRTVSPTESIQSTVSTTLPIPQSLSPTDPLPPAFLNRERSRGPGHVNFQGHGGSALRDSVVADEEFDGTYSRGEEQDSGSGEQRDTPTRRGTVTGTDDDEIVKSPTMTNPPRSRKRNKNKRKKKNAAGRANSGADDGKSVAHITTTPASPPKASIHDSPTSPTTTRNRRGSQFSHTTPGPQTGEKTTRNMAGVGYHWLSNTGSEPGVDVTQDVGDYANLKDPVRVTIVDYSSDGQGTRVDVPGKKLKMWLNSPDGERPVIPKPGTNGDEKDKLRSVRWINVDGINFEILKFLTLRYGLHPLAVEDTLRASNNPRSKLDFYANHLYLQMLVQHIRPQDRHDIKQAAKLRGKGSPGAARKGYGSTEEGDPLEGSAEEEDEEDEDEDEETIAEGSTAEAYESSGQVETGKPKRRRTKVRSGSSGSGRRGQLEVKGQPGRLARFFGKKPARTNLPEGVDGVFEPIQTIQPGHGNNPSRNAHSMTIDHLAAQYMIPLRRSVMSVFMMRDGTIITMSASAYSGILDPIYLRLENKNGLLRRTCDASMLMEALLDVVVDIAIEITQAFESEILKMEAGCLVNPQMESVRHLHIISSQLTRLKRTLSPLSNVLYTLRDRDSQRALVSALYGTTHGEAKDHHTSSVLGYDSTHSTGYISQTTKVYLSDVIDHMDTMLTSLDQYLMTCDHLTDYIFNMLSFITNESMERLSLVTVIFLPLTFMAGYYGMNFTEFPALENPDAYFWKITAPMVVGFFVVFCSSYIKNAFATAGRVLGRKRREDLVMRYERDEKNRVYRRD